MSRKPKHNRRLTNTARFKKGEIKTDKLKFLRQQLSTKLSKEARQNVIKKLNELGCPTDKYGRAIKGNPNLGKRKPRKRKGGKR